MKKTLLLFLVFLCIAATAQDKPNTVPQGAGIPGLGGIALGMNGPGFIEMGGSYSGVSNDQPHWGDAYLRGLLSGGSNAIDGEMIREDRYGDTGWWFAGGWTRTWSPNWYTDLHFGSSSVSGFFLPRARVDAFVNRKLLPRKQLVLTLGGGYDKSKTVNSAARAQIGGIYYFEHPFILQGGVTFTHANPGGILARSQYVAVTQGHDKEHFFTVRAEIGREGYELIGPQTALFDFMIHNYSANWRQWVGVNWGFNAAFAHETNPSFRRNGGTLGLFLDF